MQKIRIVGPCGSGKTTIARYLSKHLEIPFYQTDNFVWDRSEEAKKYDEHIRDAMLLEVIGSPGWIIEGVHYKWSTESFKEADVIFVIDTPIYVCDWRAFLRFIKTRIGLEQSNYKQSFRDLISMFGWNHNYEMNKVLSLTEEFKHKRVTVRRSKDIPKYVA